MQLIVLNETRAFQCSYVTNGDKFKDKPLEDWEEEWIDLLEDISDELDKHDSSISVSYNAFRSFDDELARSVANDVGTFTVTFIIISILASVAVLRFKRKNWHCCSNSIQCKRMLDPIRSRACTAIFGVLGAGLSVAASFGLAGGIVGIKFNSVASVSPFLLLGLGGMFAFIFLFFVFI